MWKSIQNAPKILLWHWENKQPSLNSNLKPEQIKCNLETDMKKHFWMKKDVTEIAAPDAKAPFIQYEQFLLNKSFRRNV